MSVAIAALACICVAPALASAETATYSAIQKFPVPPASTFEGSAGGDGWGIALSSSREYNVFHHESFLGVACHIQATAAQCTGYPKTVTETSGAKSGFSTGAEPGMFLSQSTGKLYVDVTRNSDESGGVACIDTHSSSSNPFCGFTRLTGAKESPRVSGISGLSNPVILTHGSSTYMYSFNYVAGTPSGARDKLTCFNLSKHVACSGQPYTVKLPAKASIETSTWPPMATDAGIGGNVIIPIQANGSRWLACFSSSALKSCGGSWPVKFTGGSENGAPFPLLASTGATTGVCFSVGTDPCFNMSGKSVATPAKMTEAIGETGRWGGAAAVLGPRVYLPSSEHGSEKIVCYDYSSHKSCTNFPKALSNIGLVYSVNPDPQRPTCLWVNGDDGSAQIQNFDAYTGEKCGEGSVRVLAAQFVVPKAQCIPETYLSLQVINPPRNSYSSATVGFYNGDGEPTGLPELKLDKNGRASLVGLHLNSKTGLPQFLFTFKGVSKIGKIDVKLTWKANYNAACNKAGMKIARPLHRAHLASAPTACINASSYVASVTGSPIQSVTYRLNGHTVAVVRKANKHGQWTAHIGLQPGVSSHLTAYVRYQPFVSAKSATLSRTLLRCAGPKNPAFTG